MTRNVFATRSSSQIFITLSRTVASVQNTRNSHKAVVVLAKPLMRAQGLHPGS